MTPCLQARIQTALARSLSIAATGVLTWYLALPIAQLFSLELGDPLRIGIGCGAALVAFFVSRRALNFTEDCLAVPDAMAPGVHDPKRRVCRKKTCRFYAPEDEKAGKQPDDKTAAKKHECGGAPPTDQTLKTTVVSTDNMKVTMQSDSQGILVTVTIEGITSGRFKNKQNGLRSKLEGINGIKWDDPKNLGEGSREMIGRIVDQTNREAVIARLQQVARSL